MAAKEPADAVPPLQFLAEGPRLSRDDLVLLLVERMTVMQSEVRNALAKLDRIAEEQATNTAVVELKQAANTAVVELTKTVKEAHAITEIRLRLLEDWKTATDSQLKLIYGLCALSSAAAAAVGHFWKD